MALLVCRQCGSQIEASDLEENPDWVCPSCLETTVPTASAHQASPPSSIVSIPCPACGAGVRLKAPKDGAKYKCPSCQQVAVHRKGELEVFDEFKEMLKKRSQKKLGQSSDPGPAAVTKKPGTDTEAAETEEEAEHAPAGLILTFIWLPLLLAFGLNYWGDGMAKALQIVDKVLKVLGLAAPIQ